MLTVERPTEKNRRLIAKFIIFKDAVHDTYLGWCIGKEIYRRYVNPGSEIRCSICIITSDNRMVSTSAALVVASLPPIDLLILEKKSTVLKYIRRSAYHCTKRSGANTKWDKEISLPCMRLLSKWQKRWKRTDRKMDLQINVLQWISKAHREMSD